MMAARVAGVPRPGFLHGFRQFLLVESLACRLHGREQRAFREALGRPSLLFQGFDIDHLLRLSLRQTRRQDLLPSLFLAASRTPLRLLLDGRYPAPSSLAAAPQFLPSDSGR